MLLNPPTPVTNCHTFSDPSSPRAWPNLWTASPLFRKKLTSHNFVQFLCFLPHLRVSPYFEHDAFMHHAIHVLDVPEGIMVSVSVSRMRNTIGAKVNSEY